MQFIPINPTDKLETFVNTFGRSTTGLIMSANGLDWKPNVGQQFYNKCNAIVQTADAVDYQRKTTLLNSYVQDDDVFERAALAGSSEWKVLSQIGTFPDMLKVPETLTISDYSGVLGSGRAVSRNVYEAVMSQLKTPPHVVDPSAFNEYSTIQNVPLAGGGATSSNTFQWFKLPWGEVSLYSSLDQESMDFPCYPEEFSDGRIANYTTLPDLLYQYEPWQLYQSSGPRKASLAFHFHRDMWSGDHRDGMANKLIRFCEAHCYPKFNGSLVNTSISTMYVHGYPLIRGVITDVSPEWSGPLGLDGWYLECKLTLTITEVSEQPLNYDKVKSLPLIG